MKKTTSLCLINGHWCEARSGAVFSVKNPATGEVIADVPLLEPDQIREAIEAAHAAFPAWRERPARERGNFLRALGNYLTEHAELFAQTITKEQGKPLKESRAEVIYSANYLFWFAEEAMRVYGDIIPSESPHKKILVLKQPIGVAAAITPWNFPIAMLARKFGAALAAGCTFIAKPAPETPLSMLLLGQACQDVGLPPGVFNIITGDAEMIGSTLMSSPLVKKLSFTGSTEVGKILIRQSADTVKKLTLELGGNAPFIVFDDADIEKALSGAIFGKYRNAGQTCICVNRFLVQEGIAQRFTQLLAERSKKLIVGNGADEATDIGPLITDEARQKVSSLIASATHEGAQIVSGDSSGGTSRFCTPYVISGVTPAMRIWNEEIFGPVSTITTFRDASQAIALANDTQYGLAAYVYSNDLSKALSVAEQLDFGMVGINDTAISNVQAPFGGVKQSGFGREGSKYGIDEYLVLKYLALG